MNLISNTNIKAIDLTITDLTLQFAHQVGLPCKEGLTIEISPCKEGVIDVSVLIPNLGKKNEFRFCIQQNNSRENTWEVACIYPIHLIFDPETLESNLPPGFKYTNSFKARRDETYKFEFDRI